MKFSSTWWGKTFIEALEGFTSQTRETLELVLRKVITYLDGILNIVLSSRVPDVKISFPVARWILFLKLLH